MTSHLSFSYTQVSIRTPSHQQGPSSEYPTQHQRDSPPGSSPFSPSRSARQSTPLRRLSRLHGRRQSVRRHSGPKTRHAARPKDPVRKLRQRLVPTGAVRDVVDRAVVGSVRGGEEREPDGGGRGAEDGEDVLEERGADLSGSRGVRRTWNGW